MHIQGDMPETFLHKANQALGVRRTQESAHFDGSGDREEGRDGEGYAVLLCRFDPCARQQNYLLVLFLALVLSFSFSVFSFWLSVFSFQHLALSFELLAFSI